MPAARRPKVDRCAKRKRTRRGRSGRGGVSPGLILGIGKRGYAITKALGKHQQKNAEKIHKRRMAEIRSGKRKPYAGGSFNCCIM